jgi:Holliday junction resolvase RusA-like endonuclease
MKHSYCIPGKPIPWQRPKVGRFGKSYDPQKEVKEEVGWIIKHQHGRLPLFKGSLSLEIVFYMPIPESWSTVKKQKFNAHYHISRPDFSNMLKFYEDVCQGILYHDDCLIATVTGSKIYDPEPRTVITIKEIDNE